MPNNITNTTKYVILPPQCIPPMVPVGCEITTDPNTGLQIFSHCSCVMPNPQPLNPPSGVCTISLVYPVDRPSDVRVVKDFGCEQAGMEIAMAVMLARLIQMLP